MMYNTNTAPMTNNSSQVQFKEVNTVYVTKNLSIFKNIEGNRNVNLQHIRRLVHSISNYGMLQNPILVNKNLEVIDGQHRLLAAKELNTEIYFMIIDGDLKTVQVLNINQKNWTKQDYMDGYASMGYSHYIKLKMFFELNSDFTFSDCIALCQNTASSTNLSMAHKFGHSINQSKVFEEGTWEGKDFYLAQELANKIRLIGGIYKNYRRSSFVGTMITLLQNKNFDFNEFMHKLRLQPNALVDCVSREDYRTLIEDIYNFKRRDKVSFKYAK